MTTLDDHPLTISVGEAAEILGIGRHSAYRAAATGELPTIRVGRRLLVPTARLGELLGMPASALRGGRHEPAADEHRRA